MKNRLLAARKDGIEDPDPKKKVATTQAQVDIANAEARRFAIARNLVSGENTFVARKPGDPLPLYINASTGKPDVPVATRPRITSLPSGVELSDVKSDGDFYWFDDPHTGDVVEVDPIAFSALKYRKSREQIGADLLYRNRLAVK